jgi:hypothetical protein
LRVTVDGFQSAPPKRVGQRVTSFKSHLYNYDLLAEVNFWRDFLSGGKPRIVMTFGTGQAIVLSTTLTVGAVTWPGIPEEHAKPFRNVDYSDDLFSWAEIAELEGRFDQELKDEYEWDDPEEDYGL